MLKAIIVLAFCLFAPVAKADGLVLTITNPDQVVTYTDLNQLGTTHLAFSGHLFNNSNQSLTIGTPLFPCCDPYFYSFSVEINNTVTSLGINYNYQFPVTLTALTQTNDFMLFDLGIPFWNTHAPAGMITGTFTVNYFYPDSLPRSTTQNFSVNVPAGISAPEPASVMLLLSGVVGLLVMKKLIDFRYDDEVR